MSKPVTGLDTAILAPAPLARDKAERARPPRARRTGQGRLARATRADRLGAAAFLVLVMVVLITVLGPALPLPESDSPSLGDRLTAPMTTGKDGTLHLFGTDQLGRDVLARTISGAVVSLGVAIAAVIISGTVGTILGLLAGYRGGMLDYMTMRLVDFQMAMPALLLAIFLLYLIGTSIFNLVMLLSILGWYSYTRIVRSETLRLRSAAFIDAAVVIGCSPWRIMRHHLLPQVVPLLIVIAVLDFSTVILAEAGISFLGFGVQPPDTSWGRMIAEGQAFITTGAWWLFAAPGLALFITVLSVRLSSGWISSLLTTAQTSGRER
jgi:peptide/nickel transport system permease protein